MQQHIILVTSKTNLLMKYTNLVNAMHKNFLMQYIWLMQPIMHCHLMYKNYLINYFFFHIDWLLLNIYLVVQ